ncbi:MAG: Glycotransferase domain protein [Candidatus Midichloria mitochondrii]
MGLTAFHVFFIFGSISAVGVLFSPILIFYIDNLFINVFSAFNFFLFFVTSIRKAKKVCLDNKWLNFKCYLFPFYLVLQVVPSIRSLFQLMTRPYYWGGGRGDHTRSELLSPREVL